MTSRFLSTFLLFLSAVACGSAAGESSPARDESPSPGGETDAGDGDGGDLDGDPVDTPPSRPEDVVSLYERMGNACNGGRITRTFGAVTGIDANNLWTTPADDEATLASPKLAAGWPNLVAASKLVFEGLSDDMQTTSPKQAARCGRARDIFTPLSRDERTSFTNVLLYAGEHPHVDSIPSRLEPVDAPVRLRGYLDVSSGAREVTGDVVTYADVTTQHLPIYVSCEKPLRVVRELRSVSKDDVEALDRSTCQLDGKDDDAHACVFERLEHVENNRCTFVAVGVHYRTAEGVEQRLSFGGKVEAGSDAPLRYRVIVDRYAFHGEPRR